MTTKTMTKTRKAPARAFSLALADACKIGELQMGERDSNFVAKGPITLTAVSGIPFSHWYWGDQTVVDVAGVKTSKAKIAIDWCHDPDEVLGYGSIVEQDGQLIVEGELISTELSDRASDVLKKGAEGVPYEASIKFDHLNGLVVEEFAAGTVAEANGQSYPGPITIIRECLLRGVSVCLHGADPHSGTEFSADDSKAAELSVTVHEPEAEADPEQPADHPAADPPAGELTAPADPRAEFRATLADYSRRFGAELGSQWAIEGKPLADAYGEFVERLTTEHAAQLAASEGKATAAEAKAAELQARIGQLGELAAGGEKQPVSSNPAGPDGGKPDRAAEFADRGATPGVAKFAAGMRLNRTRPKHD